MTAPNFHVCCPCRACRDYEASLGHHPGGVWQTPAPGDVVKDGAGRRTTGPDGKTSVKRGRSYTWLECSVCGQGSWISGLAPDQSKLDDPDYFQSHGRPCRMTPRCRGRHVVSERKQ